MTGSQPFASTLVGTPHYCAPEIFEGRPYGDKADIYSFGACVYEMMHGRPPHADVNNVGALVRRVLNLGCDADSADAEPSHSGGDNHIPMDTLYSDHLRRLVAMCLARSPEQRPSSDELLLQVASQHARNCEGESLRSPSLAPTRGNPVRNGNSPCQTRVPGQPRAPGRSVSPQHRFRGNASNGTIITDGGGQDQAMNAAGVGAGGFRFQPEGREVRTTSASHTADNDSGIGDHHAMLEAALSPLTSLVTTPENANAALVYDTTTEQSTRLVVPRINVADEAAALPTPDSAATSELLVDTSAKGNSVGLPRGKVMSTAVDMDRPEPVVVSSDASRGSDCDRFLREHRWHRVPESDAAGRSRKDLATYVAQAQQRWECWRRERVKEQASEAAERIRAMTNDVVKHAAKNARAQSQPGARTVAQGSSRGAGVMRGGSGKKKAAPPSGHCSPKQSPRASQVAAHPRTERWRRENLEAAEEVRLLPKTP